MDGRLKIAETTFEELRSAKNEQFEIEMKKISLLSKKAGKQYENKLNALKAEFIKEWELMER